jgi:predicted nucleotide-binding protein (sugar kinase/HSP70/actin superfamily)
MPIAPFRLASAREKHYRTFQETFTEPGTISQRTYLFPAPSRAQGELIVAFMRKANIRSIALPLEDETCLALGKTYTNRGQCTPVVYLTGNLIKYLLELRRQGISDNEILRNYGFVMLKTSGGACRLPAFCPRAVWRTFV